MTGKKKVNDFSQINRVIGFNPNHSESSLICITNFKEVLRVTRKQAKKYFFKEIKASDKELDAKKALGYKVDYKNKDGDGIYLNPTNKWRYTTKKVYKQYRDSLIPDSNIPAPTFQYKDKKGSTKPKNFFE